jgi:MSHA biogenesis protein MshI
VKAFTKRLKKWLFRYFKPGVHATQKKDQVGIYLSKEGLTFAYMSGNTQSSILQQLLQLDEINPQTQQFMIKEKVTSLHLQGTKTTVLLSQKDCQIFLMEQPKVQESEKKEAVRWQIASIIDFPIEEAIVDYIELPSKEAVDSTPMMYVVVADKRKIQSTIEWIEATGLKVNAIDICQNALLKIAFLLEGADEGQALLHLEKNTSYLIIFKERTLYMMRELEIGLAQLEILESEKSATPVHDLSVEIQRTLDYCASNLKNAGVSRLVLTPLENKKPQLLSNLSNILGLPVREMDYSEIVQNAQTIPIKKAGYTLAIGAALR